MHCVLLVITAYSLSFSGTNDNPGHACTARIIVYSGTSPNGPSEKRTTSGLGNSQYLQFNYSLIHTSIYSETILMCLSSNVTVTTNDVFNNVSITNTGGGACGHDLIFLIAPVLLLNTMFDTFTYTYINR